MLTMNIYYTGNGNSAKEFAQEMILSGIVSEIRKKKGNLRYEYFYPLEDSETVLLIDSWDDQKALDEHHQSATMENIMKLREKYNLSMRVERYINDNAGIPTSDEKYIKRS